MVPSLQYFYFNQYEFLLLAKIKLGQKDKKNPFDGLFVRTTYIYYTLYDNDHNTYQQRLEGLFIIAPCAVCLFQLSAIM